MLASASNMRAFGEATALMSSGVQNAFDRQEDDKQHNASSKATNDTHSESSAGSPVDYSLAIDCSPQDLSQKTTKQQLTKGNSNAASDTTASDFKSSSPVSSDADADLLELKCTHCGCLFATEQMLKMHIMDMHSNKQRISQGSEADAVNGLLSLNQDGGVKPMELHMHPNNPYNNNFDMLAKELEGETPVNGKIFNPEAYCELCQKEFCNKYYLATHRATKHGQPTTDCSKMASLGLPTMVSSYGGSSMEGEAQCHMCNMSFGNQFLLQGHMLTVHAPAATLPFTSSLNPFQAMYTAQLMGGLGGGAPMGGQDQTLQSLLHRMKLMAAMSMQGGSPLSASPFAAMQQAQAQQQQQQQQQQQHSSRAMDNLPFNSSDLQQHINQATQQHKQQQLLEPGQQPQSTTNPYSSGMSMVGTSSSGMWDSMAGSLSPGAQAKEAYCEYCDKTFCNKYFLKTHKMKKHGIGCSPSANEDEGLRMMPYPSMVSSESVIKSTQSLSSQQQPIANPQSYLEALMNGAMKSENEAQTSPTDSGLASENSEGDPLTKVPKLEARTESVHDQEQTHQHNDNQSAQSHINNANNQFPLVSHLSCNLCSKNFPSVFALVAHKYRDHNGAGMDATPGLPAGFGGLTGLTAGYSGVGQSGGLTSGIPFGNRTPQKENDPMMAEGRSPQAGQVTDPEAYCEICKKEFCSKYFLRTHKQNIHGIPMENTPPHTSNSMPTMFNSYTPEKMNKSLTPLGASPSMGKSRSRYSVGKNFCDVCNKEVCNKYFLRTHMLKMHGIVIDENKTVIGNINTLDKEKSGALVFRCDICTKEFQTRHLLKAHKQTSHGLTSSPSTPSLLKESSPYPNGPVYPATTGFGSGYMAGPPNVTVSHPNQMSNNDQQNLQPDQPLEDYVCKMCDQRFSNGHLLNLHMMSEHGSGETDPLQCEFCQANFSDVPSLQLHLINLHVAEIQAKAVRMSQEAFALKDENGDPAESADQNESINREQSQSINQSITAADQSLVSCDDYTSIDHNALPRVINQTNGTKLYRCSYCHYYTKWRSNLSVHERRHTHGENNKRVNTEKPHVCDICLRAYRYAHSLERHKSVHRLSAQWANSPQKRAQKLAHSPEKTAKRFRCTQCEKVFRSRELCRSHLLNVHRREGLFSPYKSPSKSMATPDRSVSEVVEDVHASVCQRSYAQGYSEPRGDPSDPDRPYILQAFAMQADSRVDVDSDAFLDSVVYLPVRNRVNVPVKIAFTLIPADPKGGEIMTI